MSTSQQFKQLKESLKPFKKEKKTLESEMNEIEKQFKQLKTTHQSVLKTMEFKCTFWITIDETLLKMKIKRDHITNLTQITKDTDNLTDKYLESVLKYLKVNSSIYLIIL